MKLSNYFLKFFVVDVVQISDSVQNSGNIILNNDSVHRDHAVVRIEPAVCRACQLGVGLGCGLLLHLVRRNRHGRDLFLFPCMY